MKIETPDVITPGTWLALWVVLAVVAVIAITVLVSYSRRRDTETIQSLQGELDDTAETLESLKLRLGKAREDKDHAYEERNYLITLLARQLLEAGRVGEGADQWQIYKGRTEEFVGWEGVLYFVPPKASPLLQMSWHFATDHDWMLEGLAVPEAPAGLWDGRSAEAKYQNLRAYLRDEQSPATGAKLKLPT